MLNTLASDSLWTSKSITPFFVFFTIVWKALRLSFGVILGFFLNLGVVTGFGDSTGSAGESFGWLLAHVAFEDHRSEFWLGSLDSFEVSHCATSNSLGMGHNGSNKWPLDAWGKLWLIMLCFWLVIVMDPKSKTAPIPSSTRLESRNGATPSIT